MATQTRIDSAVPARAGVGLKPAHYRAILEDRPDIGFFEVHAENYMGAGGPPHRYLEAIRASYPLSLHGVALSIGADRPLDQAHLRRLKSLVERYQPGLFSEHLAWSSHGEDYLNDLLPIPYTEETLQRVCEHIDEVQTAVGRRMLLENPSTYVVFAESIIPEGEFLAEVARRTGCGLLLDVSNVVVSSTNHGYDAAEYLGCFPLEKVGEIHLGGFAATEDEAGLPLLIDDHGSAISAAAWALYRHVLGRLGTAPTLIEWDNEVPDWPTLFAEARRAEFVLGEARHADAA
jgi:uncharacterized protein (UPF0276 family)